MCVFSVTSLWRQSLFTLGFIVIDKEVKQQRICLKLGAYVDAKGGHFEHKL